MRDFWERFAISDLHCATVLYHARTDLIHIKLSSKKKLTGEGQSVVVDPELWEQDCSHHRSWEIENRSLKTADSELQTCETRIPRCWSCRAPMQRVSSCRLTRHVEGAQLRTTGDISSTQAAVVQSCDPQILLSINSARPRTVTGQ